MPEMDGAELARRIRQDMRYDQIPIIMLTSTDSMEDGQPFSSFGVQARLNKPRCSAVLFKTIVDLMEPAPANGKAIAAAELMRAVA
jgi:CheY-like chemotaxis protein